MIIGWYAISKYERWFRKLGTADRGLQVQVSYQNPESRALREFNHFRSFRIRKSTQWNLVLKTEYFIRVRSPDVSKMMLL